MKNFVVGLAALLVLLGAGRPALSVTVPKPGTDSDVLSTLDAPAGNPDTDTADGLFASPASERATPSGMEASGRAPAQPDFSANRADGASGETGPSSRGSQHLGARWSEDDGPLSHKWDPLEDSGITVAPAGRRSSGTSADDPIVVVPADTAADFAAKLMFGLGLAGLVLIGLGAYIFKRYTTTRMY